MLQSTVWISENKMDSIEEMHDLKVEELCVMKFSNRGSA